MRQIMTFKQPTEKKRKKKEKKKNPKRNNSNYVFRNTNINI